MTTTIDTAISHLRDIRRSVAVRDQGKIDRAIDVPAAAKAEILALRNQAQGVGALPVDGRGKIDTRMPQCAPPEL
jgi:hypothetical protein